MPPVKGSLLEKIQKRINIIDNLLYALENAPSKCEWMQEKAIELKLERLHLVSHYDIED